MVARLLLSDARAGGLCLGGGGGIVWGEMSHTHADILIDVSDLL